MAGRVLQLNCGVPIHTNTQEMQYLVEKFPETAIVLRRLGGNVTRP